MSKHIRVVGAVVVKDGLVLCAERGPHGNLPGAWEFPGGKIEEGESPADALKREIVEELNCLVDVGDEITTTSHDYEFGTVTLTTFYCQLVSGTPQASEHAALAWLRPEDLNTVTWAPADVPAVELIQSDMT